MSDNHSSQKSLVIFSAGGKGTRIQALNSSLPKPMIPIAGKPILQWGIENLVAQGYKNFIITVSHKAGKIMDYFGDGRDFGCSIEYFEEQEPLGNAGALFKLWSTGQIEDGSSFFYLIADAIFDIDADRFWNYHCNHQALASLLSHPNSHPADSSLLVLSDDGRVEQWLNKEDERPRWYKNSVNAGLQILSTELLEKSGIDVASVSHEKKVDLDRDVLKPLIHTQRIFGYHSSEFCKDAGTPERFKAVEADITSGLVHKRNLKEPQRAVFLDRDGTINKYVGFLRDINKFELIDGVAEAIKLLNASPYLVIVVTNQPVVARGEVSMEALNEIHCKMETLLGEQGAYLDGTYTCIHHPHAGYPGEVKELKIDCDCRKPKPGLVLRAAEEFNIDLSNSWFIGDSWRDVECGRNAGTKTILLTGTGTETEYESKRDGHNDPNLTATQTSSGTQVISPIDGNSSSQIGESVEANEVDIRGEGNTVHPHKPAHPEPIAPDYTEPTLLSAVRMIVCKRVSGCNGCR